MGALAACPVASVQTQHVIQISPVRSPKSFKVFKFQIPQGRHKQHRKLQTKLALRELEADPNAANGGRQLSKREPAWAMTVKTAILRIGSPSPSQC